MNIYLRFTSAQGEQYLGCRADVLDCRGPRPNLSTQDVVENLSSIFLSLKVDFVQVAEQHQQEAGVVHLLRQLGEQDVRLLLVVIAKDYRCDVRKLFTYILLKKTQGLIYIFRVAKSRFFGFF